MGRSNFIYGKNLSNRSIINEGAIENHGIDFDVFSLFKEMISLHIQSR